MNVWHPIERVEPPRDGTWINVTSAHNNYYRGTIRWNGENWFDCLEGNHDDFMNGEATHWQQFPLQP